MKKTVALLLICLVSGLSDYAFAAQKIMTVHQRAAGAEATTPNSIPGINEFATPVGTGVTLDTANALIGLGGGVRDTDGAVWYGGDSDAAYCLNGICNFGIGIRAYFEFRFMNVDNDNQSRDYGNGFTFAIINGFNNDKTKRGGSPTASGLEALMAYAGPGNTTDELGLRYPKMAIEFDTYPNRQTGNVCSNNRRNDPNNRYNHLSLMFWGANPVGTCGVFPIVSYDDNVHSASIAYPTAGYNTTPINSASGDATGGYYSPGPLTWLEDNTVHRFRIEVVRESTLNAAGTGYNYIVKAWTDCTIGGISCTAAQLVPFQDTTNPYPPTGLSPQINRTTVLSPALHTNFNTMLFGFTQATGSPETQNIEIKNFAIYFPPCSSDKPPGEYTECADEGGTCSFSGTRLVAYGRNCFYNYQNATGSIGCNNTAFAPDPISGVYKKCYYK